jgi:hypothetical protein
LICQEWTILKLDCKVRIPLQRNLEKAAYWYKKAYKSGDDCGALNLAIDRRKQGNIRSAVIWFKNLVDKPD